jgi:hypothetical protein
VAVTAAIGLVIAVGCSLLMPNRHLAGVVALILALGLAAGGRQPLLTIALLSATGAVLWAGTLRMSIDWSWIGRWLRRVTVVVALAVAIEVVQLGRVGDVLGAVRHQVVAAAAPSSSSTAAPDIWVILLDGYPRHDVLAESFGVDDSEFLDGLEERGFDVSSTSHSNYLSTIPSLISFLNHRPLADVPAVAAQVGHPGSDFGPTAHRAIEEAAILDEARGAGYETVALASGFEDTEVRSADRFLDGSQMNDFELAVVRPTMLAPLALALDSDAFSASQRDRIEWMFATMEGLASEPRARPQFVFAHVPTPHRPWVVDGDGRPVAATDLETWYFGPDVVRAPATDVGSRFGGQIRFAGARSLRTIDALLARAASTNRPQVILVVSDHGAVLDPAEANSERRLRNLFAAYTPGRSDLFADNVTLINVFPTLFSSYLNRQLPRADEAMFTAGPAGLFDPVRVAP